MIDEFLVVQKVLVSIIAGYLMGSVPFAHIAGKLNGVDIFATGNKRAGTANVFWNISRRTGVLVGALDVAKGALAVVVAQSLGVAEPVVLVAGGAAVVGHWKSVFTGFRGGDGMATLLGIAVTLAPALALSGVMAGLVVILLLRRSPFRSASGLASCFIVILGLSQYYQIERIPALGLGIIAVLVIFHNIIVGRRSGRFQISDDRDVELDLELNLDQDSELGAPTPENQ